MKIRILRNGLGANGIFLSKCNVPKKTVIDFSSF